MSVVVCLQVYLDRYRQSYLNGDSFTDITEVLLCKRSGVMFYIFKNIAFNNNFRFSR